MKSIFYLFIISAAVYGVFHYVSSETRSKTLAAIGLDRFFTQTFPSYLRGKLSIPENPANRRKELLDELFVTISNTQQELDAIAPPPGEGNRLTGKIPHESEIRERIEKARGLLAHSGEKLAELEKTATGGSLFTKTAERILDKIFPAPAASGPAAASLGLAADGRGGDSGDGTSCLCSKP